MYIAEVTFKKGKKRLYTGQTGRSVYIRLGEHMKAQKTGANRTYTGRGVFIRLIGSIHTPDRFKTEKVIKRMSSGKKRRLARFGAWMYKKNDNEKKLTDSYKD